MTYRRLFMILMMLMTAVAYYFVATPFIITAKKFDLANFVFGLRSELNFVTVSFYWVIHFALVSIFLFCLDRLVDIRQLSVSINRIIRIFAVFSTIILIIPSSVYVSQYLDPNYRNLNYMTSNLGEIILALAIILGCVFLTFKLVRGR